MPEENMSFRKSRLEIFLLNTSSSSFLHANIPAVYPVSGFVNLSGNDRIMFNNIRGCRKIYS